MYEPFSKGIYLFDWILPCSITTLKEEEASSKEDFIPIYIIHQSKMTARRERLERQCAEYFIHHSSIYLVEPYSKDYVTSILKDLYERGYIHHSAYLDLKAGNPVHRGTLTLSSLSLYLTNLWIYQKELSHNRAFMILEDDFVVFDDWPKKSQEMFALLFSFRLDWDMVYFACHYPFDDRPIDETDCPLFLPLVSRVHGMGAVLYHPRALSKLLSRNLFPVVLQIDHDIPDKLILKRHLYAFVVLRGPRGTLLWNDNLGGTTTQVSS